MCCLRNIIIVCLGYAHAVHQWTVVSGLCVIRGVDTRSTGAVGVSGVTRAVRAQDVRPLCESWAVWADNRLSGIAAAWKAAVASLP